jgi:hypothetical protein
VIGSGRHVIGSGRHLTPRFLAYEIAQFGARRAWIRERPGKIRAQLNRAQANGLTRSAFMVRAAQEKILKEAV